MEQFLEGDKKNPLPDTREGILEKIGNDILFRIVVQYHLRRWA
jgi:hypothetical protein